VSSVGGDRGSNDAHHLDPRQLAAQLDSLQRSGRESASCDSLELYHRKSLSMRVRRDPFGEDLRFGLDEGLAVRAVFREDDALRFAASSGGDAAALGRALDLAARGPAAAGAAEAWHRRRELLHTDHDAEAELPRVEELKEWLARAVANSGVEPKDQRRAWVEVALTIESWAMGGGMQATRRRRRAWAYLEPDPGPPVIVAARNWAELPAEGWARALADRRSGERRGNGTSLAFSPEASAILVEALVRAIHTGDGRAGHQVGPGWVLDAKPLTPGALFGGRFDDSGFPVADASLADGSRVTGLVRGPGSMRRPSFRDPPVGLASHVVVRPSGAETPPVPIVPVSGVSIHAFPGGEWVLELTLPRGEGQAAAHTTLRSRPEELIRRCVDTFGPVRASHRGVVTPALILDGLASPIHA